MPSIYKSIANKNSDKAKDKAKDNAKDNAKKAVKYEYAGKLYNSLAAQQAAKAKALAMKSGESKGVARVAKEKTAAETKKIAREQGVSPREVPGLKKTWAMQKKRNN